MTTGIVNLSMPFDALFYLGKPHDERSVLDFQKVGIYLNVVYFSAVLNSMFVIILVLLPRFDNVKISCPWINKTSCETAMSCDNRL